MTHAFAWSRLSEIAEAAPIDPVPFPTRAEVDLLRQTLGRVRKALVAGLAGNVVVPPVKKRRAPRR